MVQGKCLLLVLLLLVVKSAVADYREVLNLLQSKEAVIEDFYDFGTGKNIKLDGWPYSNRSVEPPLLIGSFNIQTLGKKKLSNVEIMVNIEKIIHHYDMILIVELMTSDERLMQRFLRDVNNFAPDGVQYNMTVSIDPHVDEFCAVLYRVDKLRILKTESYYDPEKFYRKPFFVLFDALTLRDMKRFGLIGYHVKPDKAVRELNELAEVYDFMRKKHGVEDILLMGDFNADCTYIKESDWEQIQLWMRPEFTWAIRQHTDTTTNYKSCALDRIVYAGENMNSGVILSSAKVFDYREELELSITEARAISDHWPIEIKIRGKMTQMAAQHLTSDTCIMLRDSRPPNLKKEMIIEASKRAWFTPSIQTNGMLLRNETESLDQMLSALKNLKKFLPRSLTNEQLEAVSYKINHGALQDLSSYADAPDDLFKINLLILDDASELLLCRETTVN